MPHRAHQSDAAPYSLRRAAARSSTPPRPGAPDASAIIRAPAPRERPAPRTCPRSSPSRGAPGRGCATSSSRARAGSLSFTTLLALVPLASVTLAFVARFPIFERGRAAFEAFLLKHLLPDSAGRPRARVRRWVRRAGGAADRGVRRVRLHHGGARDLHGGARDQRDLGHPRAPLDVAPPDRVRARPHRGPGAGRREHVDHDLGDRAVAGGRCRCARRSAT